MLTPSAVACLWDRDTVAAEAEGLPGVLDAIMGRFDRRPAAFYEARLAAAEAARHADATDWDAWDDAVVALDRLGRYDDAIALARAKLAALDAADPPAPRGATAAEDHRYRGLANLGTVLAHRWIGRRDAALSDTHDLDESIALVTAAIDRRPDAHFGREAWQLIALAWIRDGVRTPMPNEDPADLAHPYHPPTLLDVVRPDGHAFGFGDIAVELPSQQHLDDPVHGLVGLMTLGAGWESMDILLALIEALSDAEHGAIGTVAWLRVQELADAGRRPVHPATRAWLAAHVANHLRPDNGRPSAPVEAPLEDTTDVVRWYDATRPEIDAWQAARAAWIEARLASADPNDASAFFDGAPEPPDLDPPDTLLTWTQRTTLYALSVLVVPIVAAVLAIVVLRRMVRAVRARSAGAATPG